jgi:hypothetical protein
MRWRLALSTSIAIASGATAALGQEASPDHGMRFASAADDAAQLLSSNEGLAFLIVICLLWGGLFAIFFLTHRVDDRTSGVFGKTESLLDAKGGRDEVDR